MEIETMVMSREIIKPSSPTPKSLQKHQLSLFDQLAPPLFSSLVYFYSSNPKIPISRKSNHLKKSLSETLSRYYPIAGRLVDNLYVDCNDRGVLFAEAEANCDLSRVITNPDPNGMKELLLYKLDESQDFIFAVQATYFSCGGLALGLLIHHKIADALSYFTFANTWSAVARNGGSGVPSPKFDTAAYFPPRDIHRKFRGEDVATRIIRFPATTIAALQERYSSATATATASGSGDLPQGRRPSRVEALSAYIWTQFLLATGRQADPTKICSVINFVNLRNLADPPLSQYHFGNVYLIAVTKLAAGDGEAEVVQKLWEAKKTVYGGCAIEVKAMDGVNEVVSLADAGERAVGFRFTSACGFPLYEADFGWGKPVWAVVLGFPIKNLAIFTDRKCGGGIEAVVSLNKADMEKFEAHLEAKLLKSNL